MRSATDVATIYKARAVADVGRSSGHLEETDPSDMDYEDAAKKLIMYSRGVAKGSIGTAYGMSMGEDPVLEHLSRHPDGMTPSQLADTLGYTRPRMTRILDSLEEKGYVVREQDTRDRRRVIARCTEAGRSHARDHSSSGVSSLANTLSKMGEHDARELLRGLEIAYSLTYDKQGVVSVDDAEKKRG